MTPSFLLGAALVACSGEPAQTPPATGPVEPLPPPRLEATLSVEAALHTRRSVRAFTDEPLTDAQLGQLLWAGQGFDLASGKRTAPSAGALYPTELFVLDARGTARYHPDGHGLQRLSTEDRRAEVAALSAAQDWIATAPAILVVAAVPSRTAQKYGSRARRYCLIEAGHVSQNMLLQAVSLGLGAAPVGAFEDDALSRALALPADHAPMLVIPVGHPRE